MIAWRGMFLALLPLAASLPACTTSDPVLRQAIAEVSRRPHSARTALRPFAERGDEIAIEQICIAYGRSLDSDVGMAERAKAFGWCEHAAKVGSIAAQFHLGAFYQSGIGTLKDPEAALHWYQQAAARGHREARDEARALEGQQRLCRNLMTGCRLF